MCFQNVKYNTLQVGFISPSLFRLLHIFLLEEGRMCNFQVHQLISATRCPDGFTLTQPNETHWSSKRFRDSINRSKHASVWLSTHSATDSHSSTKCCSKRNFCLWPAKLAGQSRRQISNPRLQWSLWRSSMLLLHHIVTNGVLFPSPWQLSKQLSRRWMDFWKTERGEAWEWAEREGERLV